MATTSKASYNFKTLIRIISLKKSGNPISQIIHWSAILAWNNSCPYDGFIIPSSNSISHMFSWQNLSNENHLITRYSNETAAMF
jgi:hypothetical protein